MQSAARRTIVFDDDPAIGLLASRALRRIGLSSTSVERFDEFVRVFQADAPDLILLDLTLAETDAVEVLNFLAERRFGGNVVLVSGHSDTVLEHTRQIGEDAGLHVSGVLRKPFSVTGLREFISALPAAAPLPVPSRNSPQTIDVTLSEALERGWVHFHYQPKIRLDTAALVGAEALARIHHPHHGVILPGQFLPGTGREDLHRLASASIEAALRTAELMRTRIPDFSVAINVPAPTLCTPNFVPSLLEQSRGFSANHLILELTETELVADAGLAREAATRAVLHGFRLSIDDFGQGYASLDRLTALPFAELKVDRHFVAACARDAGFAAICKAAVAIADGFGASSVAEGVETQEQLRLVKEFGFSHGQGYFFARPLPLEKLVQMA